MPNRRTNTDFADFDSEASLRTAVAGLLHRMAEIRDVRIVHGPREAGKDILFSIRGALGEQQLCAATVRNGKFTRRDLPVLNAQLAQMQQAPYVNPDGQQQHVQRSYLIASHEIPRAIEDALLQGIRRPEVTVVSGTRLYDLFKAHWPDFVATRTEAPGASEEVLALTSIGSRIRLVTLLPDGKYRLVDPSRNLHDILYISSSETKALELAIQELEEMVNDPRLKEAKLQHFFERNPDFILSDDHRAAHPQITLARDEGGSLRPDFLLEPIDQTRLCDLLDLKMPAAQIFVMKERRIRFSAAVMEACAQLREYHLYFDEVRNRDFVKDTYGLSAYKPRMIVVIGRRGTASPIQIRQMEIDAPELKVKTYDEVVERMKYKLQRMRTSRRS